MSFPRPFFESSATQPAPARRMLVITYNFPPSQAVGGLRWQKLSHFAAERGWGVDVICAAPASVVDRDDMRLRDLPVNVRVFGVSDRPPLIKRVVHAGWRALRSLRGARARSGARAGAGTGAGTGAGAPVGAGSVARSDVQSSRWSPSTRDLARGYFAYTEFAEHGLWASDAAALAARLDGPDYQLVVSSGPPHMAHVGAASIARRRGIPHVVDLRDPWSQVQRVSDDFASPLYFKLAAKHEQAVLASASLVVTNTESAQQALVTLYPHLQDRIMTVMNGSDDDPLPRPERGAAFIVAYAGTIYLDRDPRPLFRAAARVIAELSLTPDDFRIELIGDVSSFSGVPLDEMAAEAGIAAYVKHGPSRPRAEAMQFLANATMLVSLPQDSNMAIPAKLFEYVRFEAWVLVLADADSAAARLLRGSEADVVARDDESGLTDVIRRRYTLFRAGVMPSPVGADGRFSRRQQAQPLLDRLDALAR